MKKRIMAFLLAATMLLSFVPQAVLAAPDEETPAAEPAAVESEIAAPVETPAAPDEQQPAATQEPDAQVPTQEPGQEPPAPEETSAQNGTQESEAQPSETTEAAPQETIPAQTEALTVRMFGAPVAYALGAFNTALLNGVPATANPGTGTTKWGVKNGYFCSGNAGKAYSTSTLTLTMQSDAVFRFEYKVSSEKGCDKLTITHGSKTIVSGVSGEIDWTVCEIDAKAGDVIAIAYKKDSSGDKGDDCVYLRNFSADDPVVITFDANGGDGASYTQNIYGNANLTANRFTKDHAIFAGWALTADGEVVYSDGAGIEKPEADLTLYAVWTPAWIVRFDDVDREVTVARGEALGAANVPQASKKGYRFEGWFCAGKALDASAAVKEDMTYTAKWSPIRYTIHFDATGGVGTMVDMTLDYDQSAALPKNVFVRKGYTFGGWKLSGTTYADEDLVQNLTDKDGGVVTMQAVWQGCRVEVCVDLNDGSEPTKRIGVVGENYNFIWDETKGGGTYSKLADPTRDGYLFTGWFDAPEGGNEITYQDKFDGDDAEHGVTLYAHWTQAVMIAFDANGGSCYTKTKLIKKGDSLGYLPSASQSNMVFEGWYTERTGGEKIEKDTPFTADTTLYAHYRRYSYILKFNANGGEGTMADQTVEFGVDHTLPACGFTREDYDFMGWSTSKWSSSVKYADGGVINREFDSWDNDDGESYPLYAVWKQTVFGAAFSAISAKLPSGNAVRATGALGLPASGSGWTARYESSDPSLIDNNAKVLALPETGSVSVTVKAVVTNTATGESKTREYVLTLLSKEAVEAEKTLNAAASALSYRLEPTYGTDVNACAAVEKLLAAKGYSNVTVSVKEAAKSYDGNAQIDSDGTIHYYFNPAMTGSGAYFYTTFVLHLNGASVEKQLYTHLVWDTERAKAVLSAELDRIKIPTEIDADVLTSLPRYSVKEGVKEDEIDYNKNTDLNTWVSMTWQSSDPAHLRVNDPAVPPVYAPYGVTVTQDKTAHRVTLTVRAEVSSVNVSIARVYTVTVKAAQEDPRDVIARELGEKLDAALKNPGLRDFATGAALDVENVTGDVRFPTTRDIGVDGKYQPVTITSSNENVIVAPDVNNAARVEVYRPLPGEKAETVTLTLTITDKATGAAASRSIDVTVQPLTQREIDAETALMAQVKAHYFDGIKNANTSPDRITTDLHPFTEAHLEGGKLVWSYTYDTMTGDGIVPVAMDGWEAEESWRLFRSSDPQSIAHETLLVTRDRENRAVTVTSWLSSQALGRYAVKYPNDARFAALYCQPVSAQLIVLGTAPTQQEPVVQKLSATFTLRDNSSTWLSTRFSDLSRGTSVYDVFRRAIANSGFRAEGGKFVTGITNARGVTLRNLDRGAYSGWMYSVNGSVPNVVMSEYHIKDGDAIVFFYTDDYRNIVGEQTPAYTVEEVEKLIDAIGKVDKSSGDKINAARSAYDALSAEDQKKVSNRETLFAAETAYAKLIAGAAQKATDLYRTTGDFIQNTDARELCAFGSEWMIFALARSECDLPTVYRAYEKAVEAYVSENIGEDGRLDENRVTVNARLVLALSALEYDATDVAGHDLLRAFSDFDFVTKQGLNGVAYTLLALDSRGYEIPEAEKGAKQTTRDALVDYLLKAQLADGGWAYGGETAEADMTAIVLQALAPYVAEDAKTTQEKAVAKAVDSALECLSKMQTPTGGFTSGGSVTPESASQVVVALTALGIDPQTDARFVKNGVNALDSLCSFYVEGGGFRHTMRGERDELATTQGYYALAAYWRMTQEKTPLYDMSDLDESAQKAA